jgi:gliding motility-associated-like protein
VSDPGNSYSNAGFFDVILYTRNSNNCVDQIQKRLTVISDVQFATAFTPNTNGSNGGVYDPNDYSNDVFFPFVMGVVEYDMTIFNRWGELIFKSTDVKIGWDGYFNGKLCQQDTYVYKVNMAFFDGRKVNKTGSITLLR